MRRLEEGPAEASSLSGFLFDLSSPEEVLIGRALRSYAFFVVGSFLSSCLSVLVPSLWSLYFLRYDMLSLVYEEVISCLLSRKESTRCMRGVSFSAPRPLAPFSTACAPHYYDYCCYCASECACLCISLTVLLSRLTGVLPALLSSWSCGPYLPARDFRSP